MIKKGVICFILLMFLLQYASASLGVSPAKYEINFEPNLKQTFSFEFRGDKDAIFDIYAEGDLADYLQLSTDTIKEKGVVTATLELPAELDVPGKHRLYVVAAQQAEDESGKGFALIGNARGVIQLEVPYPGKYAEVEFTTTNVKTGEDVEFKLKINNLGKEAINTKSYLEIYDSFEKKIETFYAGENALLPTESTEIAGSLGTSKYKPGKYKAAAVVEYEGKTVKKESLFRIGELYMGITKHSNNFQKDKINRFEIEAESFWNDPIENVYATVTIPEYGISFTTPSVAVNGFQKTVLTGFFDTSTIDAKTFQAKITLRYGDKITEDVVDLKFENKIDYAFYSIILTIVFFLIITIALSIKLIMLERRLNERKKK